MRCSNLLKNCKNYSQNKDASGRCSGFLLIAVICVLIYANTWNASWHMDDFPNIVTNPLVHIQDISITSLLRATNLFQDQNALYSGIPYRPVSDLTFALNWYAGGDQVWGYHAVNIGIHILCAGCLYLLLLTLFQTPNITGRFQGMENDIALLAAVFWAVLSIQTQAVTFYIPAGSSRYCVGHPVLSEPSQPVHGRDLRIIDGFADRCVRPDSICSKSGVAF